ncbi:hypothetical protein GCM10023323_35520 [Streptomyces thinghirensis]|uniref:Uncharacterized protein n=1 Tax=Streptomyces thinghirensis TaxID=551547 RepID=A0ABP9T6I5_9ACTN
MLIVEAGWQAVRDDGSVRNDLLNAAYSEPRLRQLFPWTGMGELHFSRCTEPRWTWDLPYISPGSEGTYWVLGPLRTQWIGQVHGAGSHSHGGRPPPTGLWGGLRGHT